MSFFENTRKPVGFGGKLMVAMMNVEIGRASCRERVCVPV